MRGWCITGHSGGSGITLSASTPTKILEGLPDLEDLFQANDARIGFTIAFMNRGDAMRFKMVWL